MITGALKFLNFFSTLKTDSKSSYQNSIQEIKKKLDQVSPTFCPAKWLINSLHLEDGTTHSCYMCPRHLIPLEELKQSVTALHNTKFKKDRWQEMKEGHRPVECSACWNLEDKGIPSERLHKSLLPWIHPYIERIDNSSDNCIPSSLEVSFDNICNLKCIYCGPYASTKWAEELNKFGPYPLSESAGGVGRLEPMNTVETTLYEEAFWTWLPQIINHLHILRINGGEPLLSKHFWKTLQLLKENKFDHLSFAINSNIAVSDHLIKNFVSEINSLQGRLKDFILYVSLDCTGPQAEYIRFGLKETIFFENLDFILSHVTWPINVTYIITMSALNITGFEALLKIILQQKARYPHQSISFDLSVLITPPQLSLSILPKYFSKYLKSSIKVVEKSLKCKNGFKEKELVKLNCLLNSFLKENHSDSYLNNCRSDFIKMVNEADRRRNTYFLTIFPEYRKFYHAYAKWV